jgi:hypothetical protein
MLKTDHVARRSFLAFVFRSGAEPRLRAGWRLLLQAVLQVLLTLGAILSLRSVLPSLHIDANDSSSLPSLALAELIQVVTITFSVFLARRLLDRRSFVSLGLKFDRRALADTTAGIVISGVMMGAIFLSEWMIGWLTVDGVEWSAEPLPGLLANIFLFFALFAVVSWNEELMSRGYHLQTIASGMRLPWGLILSSAIFGALHLGNPNASWISAAGIFFAGLFLGYAYIRTRQLWLSIGLHIGWNFFEGVVFGFPVSGLATYHVTRITVSSPGFLTGGAFGPEAGLIVLPAIAFGILLIHIYTRTSPIDESAD